MFDDSFAAQLSKWNKNNSLKALGFNRGVERETLRVTKNGSLSKLPHPLGLGSPLTNSYITTDFAESLIELVTPKFSSVDSLYSCLVDLHVFTAHNIDKNECLWAYSMPCKITDEADVNIAEYGSNDSGMLKHIYRKGLKVRYGSIMQCVSGIHYNFSIDDKSYVALFGENYSQAMVDNLYLGLIRNFKRNFWFILNQLGASPVADKTYVDGRNHHLEKLGKEDVYLKNATSLRMSNIGYQSPIQSSLDIRYNTLNGFIDSVKRGIKTPYKNFTNLGLYDDGGNRQQISDGVIQIENELYDTIRPKRASKIGQRPANSLNEYGIEYVEIRGVDINPDDLVGISKNQMHLLDLFLIHCFVNHSPELTNEENEKLQKNHSDMVTSGQNNSTMIFYKNTMKKAGDALTELVNELSLLAKSLDGNDKIYSNALRNVINDENKSSALVKKIDQNSSFHEVALAKSIQNTHELRQNNTLDLDYLSAERERSLKEFEEIENSPNKDIEAYVKKYNSQI